MSGEIKYVIGLLCKQLNLIFNINLKPEHLRLAKFDKNEDNVVSILWTTLSLLATKKSQINIEMIKNHMRLSNYTSENFYVLPEDFSAGSRELLIAIGFIIAKNLPNLIKEQIKQSPFDDSCSLIDLDNVYIHRPETPDTLDEEVMKNYIKWLKGKIQQNERMTEDYNSQKIKIYEKLNTMLNSKADDKLSLNEVLALSSKKYSKEFLERCSYIMDLLDCYQEWTRKERVFWKWMATVLMERETE